jgi:hypothetical protein
VDACRSGFRSIARQRISVQPSTLPTRTRLTHRSMIVAMDGHCHGRQEISATATDFETVKSERKRSIWDSAGWMRLWSWLI